MSAAAKHRRNCRNVDLVREAPHADAISGVGLIEHCRCAGAVGPEQEIDDAFRFGGICLACRKVAVVDVGLDQIAFPPDPATGVLPEANYRLRLSIAKGV